MGEKLISSGQAKVNAAIAALHLIIYYSIAIGIWGLVFKKALLWLCLSGAIVGFLISLVFVMPIISIQKSEERTKDMMFVAGAVWGNIAIVIGILGIVFWILRIIFV